MRIYSIPAILKTSCQFGMAGQMGMEVSSHNDRPMIWHHCFVYNKYIVYVGMVRCITMRIYSIPGSLKTSGHFGMAIQMGMEEPFYNDRPIILPD